MPVLDPAKAKAIVSAAKAALQLASAPPKNGKIVRIGFACAPGKSRADHILMVEARRKGPAILADLTKLAKDRKAFCCGSASVTAGKPPILWVAYTKALTGGEAKIAEALQAMNLRYLVKLDKARPSDDEGEASEGEGAGDRQSSQAASAPAKPAPEKPVAEKSTAEKPAAEKPAAEKPTADKPAALPLRATPQLWVKTRTFVDLAIKKLKAAVREEYKSEAPAVLAQLDKAWGRVDGILVALDDSLALALDKATKAADGAARQTELGKAKVILAKYVKYVQSEALIGQLDDNPFDVELNLRKTLSASLRQLAQSVA
jgi:hypothetical protein